MTDAKTTIERIADIAETIAWHAGVGGMETAGAIISYLAEHPDQIETVLFGEGVFATPVGIHEYPGHGRLTWHAVNGKIMDPQTARFARIVKNMEQAKENDRG